VKEGEVMKWFDVLRLAQELLAVIIPIIGAAFGNGYKEVEPHLLPPGLKEKVVQLATEIEEKK
jgi:hypothetical protein